MATDPSFVEFLRDQLGDRLPVSFRRMFGEYALYCDDKVVALVCDNQLFIKPTVAGRACLGKVIEAPPYPGAKMYFLMSEQLDDKDWLAQIISSTAQELPLPRPKKPKQTQPSKAKTSGKKSAGAV